MLGAVTAATASAGRRGPLTPQSLLVTDSSLPQASPVPKSCKSWCADDQGQQSWSVKCTWPLTCGGCEACPGPEEPPPKVNSSEEESADAAADAEVAKVAENKARPLLNEEAAADRAKQADASNGKPATSKSASADVGTSEVGTMGIVPFDNATEVADQCRREAICRCKIFGDVCPPGVTTDPSSKYPRHDSNHYCKVYSLCGDDLPDHLLREPAAQEDGAQKAIDVGSAAGQMRTAEAAEADEAAQGEEAVAGSSMSMSSMSRWESRPHIVLWLVDDQGWANVGYNNVNVHTPNINSLARGGVILTRQYTYPWCAPSRAALMSGRQPHVGFQGAGNRIPVGVTLMPQVLREAGYETHHIGKWHLGHYRSWLYPTARGFDTSFGFGAGNEHYVTQATPDGNKDWTCHGITPCPCHGGIDLQRNGKPAIGEAGNFSGRYFKREIERAINERNHSKPLFLYVALQAMHTPSPGPDAMDKPGNMKWYLDHGYTKNFAESSAMITHADNLIGHLNHTLNRAHIWHKTLVVHLSDNGGQITGNKHFLPMGNNWPLRGMKTTFHEGGVRVPAFVFGGALPAEARSSSRDGYIHLSDWFATFAELAGSTYQMPKLWDWEVNSHSMVSYLGGEAAESPRTSMVLGAGKTGGTVNDVEAVIQGHFKLINGTVPCGKGTWQGSLFPNASTPPHTTRVQPCGPPLYLFNIIDDPHETTNLAYEKEYQPRLKEMFDKLEEAREESNRYLKAGKAFEADRDLGMPPELMVWYCKAYKSANQGFLGPILDNAREVNVQMARARIIEHVDPTYTDDCCG